METKIYHEEVVIFKEYLSFRLQLRQAEAERIRQEREQREQERQRRLAARAARR